MCPTMDVLSSIFPLELKWFQTKKCDGYLLKAKNILFLKNNQNKCDRNLLFQSAVSSASEGSSVSFITSVPFRKMPICVHGMARPEPGVMNRLKFLYMQSGEEVLNYLSTIHQLPVLPELIVIEDLHTYANSIQMDGPEKAIAKICAMLIDAHHFILKHSGKKTTPILMASTSLDAAHTHLNIYQTFFKTAFLISPPETHGKVKKYQLKEVKKNKDLGNIDQLCIYFYEQDVIFLDKVSKISENNV